MGAKAKRKKIGWPGKTAGGIIAGLLLGAFGTGVWAEPAADSISASRDVNFDVNNMWDEDDDVWNLNLTTDEVPGEGISFAMDVLIPVSEGEEPSFEGRIRVQTALLLGESEEWAQSNAVTELVSDDFSKIVTVGGNTYGSATIVVPFSETVGTNANGQWVDSVPFDQVVTQPVRNVVIFFVGRRCDYAGEIAVSNPYFTWDPASVDDGSSVDSTVRRGDKTTLFLIGTSLVTENGDLASADWNQVILADKQADPAAAKAYAYLKAIGSTDHVIFGMQDELWSKAGAAPGSQKKLTGSDVEDITGSNAGIIGMDTLSLTGQEFSAVLYNSGFALRNGLPEIDISSLGSAAANVQAAARLANTAIDRGALVTLSCHMPNFVQVAEASDYRPEQDPSYAKYDFTTSSARNQSDDSVRQILPGGASNEKFNAYLDMIADYAGQVKGPILFRPFHEAAGGWFWWGASGGSAAEYQQLFQYTAEYLRDTKQVHNLIYVYTADVEYTQDSAAVSDQRYPGDDYVDVIGIDIYDANSEAGSGPWFSEFAAAVSAARQFADEHGKLFAVTETGIMQMVPEKGDAVIALRRSGNPETHWFGKMLDVLSGSGACYVLTWSNSTELFHVPYVKAVHRDGSLYGHEMMDGFMEFFNDRRSVFAVNQRWILEDFQ